MCSLPVNAAQSYSAIQPNSSPLPQDSERAKSAPLYFSIQNKSSSSSLPKVTYQIWEDAKDPKVENIKLWFNFFLESQEKMEKFMIVVAQKQINAVRLVKTIDIENETGDNEKENWCIRFMTSPKSMKKPLTAILEVYPQLFSDLSPLVKEINEVLMKKSLST